MKLSYHERHGARSVSSVKPYVAVEPIQFSDSYVAVPTMGGIITDFPLSRYSQLRFPAQVVLPVSERLARIHEDGGRPSWLVVLYHGKGVAMTVEEANSLGLCEAQNWIPDLTGVHSVPDVGEIKHFLETKGIDVN